MNIGKCSNRTVWNTFRNHRLKCSYVFIGLCLPLITSCISEIIYEPASYDRIDHDDLYFEILYPEDIAYTYKITSANDFGSSFNGTLKNVLLVPAQPIDLCSTADNYYDLDGNIALARRGECSFVTKTINAEKANARALVVMDSDVENDEEVISMQDDESGRKTYIPAVFIFGKDGYMILKSLTKLQLKAALINIPVNMTGIPIYQRNLPKWLVW